MEGVRGATGWRGRGAMWYSWGGGDDLLQEGVQAGLWVLWGP